jgi:hypothetical protein
MVTILNTVKLLLNGIKEDNTEFDDEILLHINSACILPMIQIGACAETFQVEEDTPWSALTPSPAIRNALQQYISMKVRLTFDPPASGYLVELYEKTIAEAEWRITTFVELMEGGI